MQRSVTKGIFTTTKRSIALAWRVSYPRAEAIDILIDSLRPH